MDVWPEEQLVKFYRLGGNTKVNSFWEATLKKSHKPRTHDRRMLGEFIRQKYASKKYLPKENKESDSEDYSDERANGNNSETESESDSEEEERRRRRERKKAKKKAKKLKRKMKEAAKEKRRAEKEAKREESETAKKETMKEMHQSFENVLGFEENNAPAQTSSSIPKPSAAKAKDSAQTEEEMLASFFGVQQDSTAADEMDALFS